MSSRPTKSLLGLLGAMLIAFLPSTAVARWTEQPACAYATNEVIPQVAAASDGADGAVIAFEATDSLSASVHRLRAIRLRANGTVDPAWPSGGVSLCSVTSVARSELGAVGDGSGGAYVWWLEGTALYVTRVAADGTVPPSWPARGRLLGSLVTAKQRPQAFSDSAGGVYIGWLGKPNAIDPPRGRIIRLGPENTGNAGWSNTPRSYAIPDDSIGQSIIQFAFCPAAEDGVWVAWGDVLWDGAQLLPGSWRVARQRTSGFDPTWPAEGLVVGEFRSNALLQPSAPTHRLVALADAGDGGVLVLSCEQDLDTYVSGDAARFRRFSADGSCPAPWSAEGFTVTHTGISLSEGGNWENSYELLPASGGGVFVCIPAFFSDSPPVEWILRVDHPGQYELWHGIAIFAGHEELACPGGTLYVSEYNPIGPYGWYTPDAYLSVTQHLPDGTYGSGAGEHHPEILGNWFGDIALAPASADGAFFVWSQHRDRHGIFARRFTAEGEVTGVIVSATPSRAMLLRFDPARGVIADGALVPGSRLALHDIGGRRVLDALVPIGDGAGFVLPGSETLSPGVYFVRATLRDGAGATAKVVVWR